MPPDGNGFSLNSSYFFQVNDVTRRLTEEEEANQALANSMRKMETDAKKMKEEVENMEEK